MSLKAVHFKLIGLGDADLGQKLAHIVALIALHLNDFAIFGMFDDGAIAGEFLLESAYEFLLVKLVGYALYGGQCLATITLLYTNMYETAA